MSGVAPHLADRSVQIGVLGSVDDQNSVQRLVCTLLPTRRIEPLHRASQRQARFEYAITGIRSNHRRSGSALGAGDYWPPRGQARLTNGSTPSPPPPRRARWSKANRRLLLAATIGAVAALAGCATGVFSEQVDALAARVDSLENAPPAARDTAGAAAVTALAARVDALENAPAEPRSGAVNAGAVTALAARVGALEGDRPAPAASAGPLVGDVAELSARVAALEEAAATRAASPATAAADGHDHRPPLRSRTRGPAVATPCLRSTWPWSSPAACGASRSSRRAWGTCRRAHVQGTVSLLSMCGTSLRAPRRPSAGSGPARNGARTLNSAARCTGGCGSVAPAALPGP